MNRRRILFWLLALFAAIMLHRAGEVLVRGRFHDISRRIAAREKTLEEINSLGNQLSSRRRAHADFSRAVSGRGREYTPIAFLESLSLSTGVEYELIYREPRKLGETGYMETAVWVELRGIGMDPLIRYLYQIENSPEMLRVRNFSLRPHEGALRAGFEVATIVP